jgi:hypothetical protein
VFTKNRYLVLLLLVPLLLFGVLAPTGEFTSAQQLSNIWNVSLPPNAQSSKHSFGVSNNCPQPQSFRVVSDLAFVKFPGGSTMVIAPKHFQMVSAVIDTTGLAAGNFAGTIKTVCDSCAESKCPFTPQTRRVRLVVSEAIPAQPFPSPSPSPSPSPDSQPVISESTDLLAPGRKIEDLSGSQLANIENELNVSGPQLPKSFSWQDITILGFVKSSRAVIEYELADGRSAELVIEVKGIKPFTKILTPSPQARTDRPTAQPPLTQQVIFTLPEEFGVKPQVGRIVIRTNGDPANFTFVALGMGEHAVGSVTIDQLTFQAVSSRNYGYGFHALRDFEKWGAEILQISRAPDKRLIGTRVKTGPVELGVDRGSQKNGNWDGKNDGGEISHGNHKVQVRVWRTVSGRNGGDWVARISQQQVKVP